MTKFGPNCAPIWGFPPHMTIADFGTKVAERKELLHEVAVDSLSDAATLGARGVTLHCEFQNDDASCSVELYASETGGDRLIKTWDGVTSVSGVLFAGNEEFVDLEGTPIKVKVVGIKDGWVTVFASLLY